MGFIFRTFMIEFTAMPKKEYGHSPLDENFVTQRIDYSNQTRPSSRYLENFWAEGWDRLAFGYPEHDSAVALGLRINFEEHVLYEDSDLLLMNKPAGIVTHASEDFPVGLTEVANECRPGADIHHVNRTDFGTSGVTVLAQNEPALSNLVSQFRRRIGMRKIYLAVVDGRFLEDKTVRINAPLAEESKAKITVVPEDHPKGKSAVSHFTPLTEYQTVQGEYQTLVAVKIETGRQHQIRVHAAEVLGMPITGDKKYNTQRGNGADRMMLHSYLIGLRHPRTGVPLSVSAQPSADFTDNLRRMKIVKEYPRAA